MTISGWMPATVPTPNALKALDLFAGAMLYVVVEELIPEMSQGQNSNVGTVLFRWASA